MCFCTGQCRNICPSFEQECNLFSKTCGTNADVLTTHPHVVCVNLTISMRKGYSRQKWTKSQTLGDRLLSQKGQFSHQCAGILCGALKSAGMKEISHEKLPGQVGNNYRGKLPSPIQYRLAIKRSWQTEQKGGEYKRFSHTDMQFGTFSVVWLGNLQESLTVQIRQESKLGMQI